MESDATTDEVDLGMPERDGGRAKESRNMGMPPLMRDALVVAQAAGIWFGALLLALVVYQTSQARTELAAVSERIYLNNLLVAEIGDAPVLQLDAVKMEGSDTWTFPVSSIHWSGR